MSQKPRGMPLSVEGTGPSAVTDLGPSTAHSGGVDAELREHSLPQGEGRRFLSGLHFPGADNARH